MVPLSDGGRAGVVGAFGTTSGRLDDILDINNVYFGGVMGQIYPSGLRLSGVNASGAEAAFFDLRVTKMYLFAIITIHFIDTTSYSHHLVRCGT